MRREKQIAVAFDDYSDAIGLSTFDDFDYIDIQGAFEKGAEWADETMIEKACKWLIEQKEMIGISFQEDFIERFKMAMKK